MFGRLKDKLKGALKVFSKEVEEEAVVVEEIAEEVQEDVVKTPVVVEEKTKAEKKKEEVKKEEKKPETKAKEEKPKPVIDSIPKKEVVSDQSSEKQDDLVKEKEPEEIIEEPEEKVVIQEIQAEVIEEESSVEEVKEPELVDEVSVDEPVFEEESKPKKSFFGKVFGKKEKVEELIDDEPLEELDDESKETSEDETEVEETIKEEFVDEPKVKKRSGFFSKLTRVTLTEEKFESLFWDLEVALLENNVAVEVIEKIKEDLKHALNGEKASKKSIEELILETLHNTLKEILSVKPIDLLKLADEKNNEGKPLIITMIGVNGSGKTTTLAKLVKYFQNHNKTIVVAAADTFRAAAIHQLEEHTTKLGVKLIKHDYNADPAAVAYDAVKHATAKNLDIVLIDSAGRLHSNDNLMNELKKLIRINKPDVNIFVGEAITGNDCVEQASLFDEAVGIDAIILAKADVDEKGGAAISASFVTGKPVIFLGVGQGYDDLQVFDPELVLKTLDL